MLCGSFCLQIHLEDSLHARNCAWFCITLALRLPYARLGNSALTLHSGTILQSRGVWNMSCRSPANSVHLIPGVLQDTASSHPVESIALYILYPALRSLLRSFTQCFVSGLQLPRLRGSGCTPSPSHGPTA